MNSVTVATFLLDPGELAYAEGRFSAATDTHLLVRYLDGVAVAMPNKKFSWSMIEVRL